MSGHLLEIDAGLEQRLRADPGLVHDVTRRYAMAGFLPSGLGEVLRDGVDQAFRETRTVGCLWRLLPRFLRHRLIERVLPELRTDRMAMSPQSEQARADLDAWLAGAAVDRLT